MIRHRHSHARVTLGDVVLGTDHARGIVDVLLRELRIGRSVFTPSGHTIYTDSIYWYVALGMVLER